MNKVDISKLAPYEQDFGLWSAEQAKPEDLIASIWTMVPRKERTNGGLASIAGQRDAINALIAGSPSLATHPARVLERSYRNGRLSASGDTGLPLSTFPTACPYAVARILDPEFLPGGN
jgi:hypothetical protein